jgi:hypothetical protein
MRDLLNMFLIFLIDGFDVLDSAFFLVVYYVVLGL